MKNLAFAKTGKVGSKKFMPKYIGPFEVDHMVGRAAMKLKLPASYRIHNVFHVSLIRPHHESGEKTPAQPVMELENGTPTWQAEKFSPISGFKCLKETAFRLNISSSGRARSQSMPLG